MASAHGCLRSFHTSVLLYLTFFLSNIKVVLILENANIVKLFEAAASLLQLLSAKFDTSHVVVKLED